MNSVFLRIGLPTIKVTSAESLGTLIPAGLSPEPGSVPRPPEVDAFAKKSSSLSVATGKALLAVGSSFRKRSNSYLQTTRDRTESEEIAKSIKRPWEQEGDYAAAITFRQRHGRPVPGSPNPSPGDYTAEKNRRLTPTQLQNKHRAAYFKQLQQAREDEQRELQMKTRQERHARKKYPR